MTYLVIAVFAAIFLIGFFGFHPVFLLPLLLLFMPPNGRRGM